MSKNKLLNVMSERAFECLQRLSIATYVNMVKNQPYDFDSYFELTYKDSLRYILEFVKYDNIDKYKDVFYKYCKVINDMSEQCAINYIQYKDTNKRFMFNWWHLNKKNFLGEIMKLI